MHRRELAEDAQLQADLEGFREGRRERPPARQHLTIAEAPENYNSTGQLIKTRPLGKGFCGTSVVLLLLGSGLGAQGARTVYVCTGNPVCTMPTELAAGAANC